MTNVDVCDLRIYIFLVEDEEIDYSNPTQIEDHALSDSGNQHLFLRKRILLRKFFDDLFAEKNLRSQN